jgi:putative PIN family toxin of toxin-antitoxin system
VNGIPRVVFDTNILFSAVGWLGNPHRCVQAARHGQCHSVTCEPVLNELAEKLRLKRDFSVAKAAEVADEIRAFSQVVVIAGALKVVAADPDDDAVVECALSGQAGFIVSGDRHLLDLGNYQGIEILTAAAFLARLAQTPPR